ncbi:MAG: class I SAM-dependent methyltransferase [Bacteroidetes bacterium]|nr:class I SAM-dependent methyltransferase [Bacteroidota bacterium]
MDIEKSGFNAKRHSRNDLESYELAVTAFEASETPVFDKLEAFARFSTKRSIARFLCKHEIFKGIINTNGVIIECGVFNGGGLFTWAQLSNIFEPTNYTRKIVGFDTFEGFNSVSQHDANTDKNPGIGDLKGVGIEEFRLSIDKVNKERHLSHIPNIELIKGDFLKTGEEYLKNNKHLLVSLLYLDFDLYEPTKKALDLFLPRMSKGAIVCFDQLNCPNFPGETTAMLESFDLKSYKLNRSNIDPWISWIVL